MSESMAPTPPPYRTAPEDALAALRAYIAQITTITEVLIVLREAHRRLDEEEPPTDRRSLARWIEGLCAERDALRRQVDRNELIATWVFTGGLALAGWFVATMRSTMLALPAALLLPVLRDAFSRALEARAHRQVVEYSTSLVDRLRSTLDASRSGVRVEIDTQTAPLLDTAAPATVDAAERRLGK